VLADFAGEGFVEAEAARLEELRLCCAEDRVEAALALGRHGAVVADLEHIVSAHPLRERPRGQLMLALYRAGRQAQALTVYQHARHVLSEELGLEPSTPLKVLEGDPAPRSWLGLEPDTA
jgi:SARP family transcriptional regulator, regulator of embCAB operon